MKRYEIIYVKTCLDGSQHIMRPWLDRSMNKYVLSPNNKRDNYIFVDEDEIIPTMKEKPNLMLRVYAKGQPTSLICLASLKVTEIEDNI